MSYYNKNVNLGKGDPYKWTYKGTDGTDKLSDFFLGTNIAEQNKANNAYEQQKATTINSYMWNKQGMESVGLNPILGAGMLAGGAQTSQIGNEGNTSGNVIEMLIQILPNLIKAAK